MLEDKTGQVKVTDSYIPCMHELLITSRTRDGNEKQHSSSWHDLVAFLIGSHELINKSTLNCFSVWLCRCCFRKLAFFRIKK